MSRKIEYFIGTKNRFIYIDDLLTDIENGHKFMKVYKQMKMYNDDELNPILYQNKKNMAKPSFLHQNLFSRSFIFGLHRNLVCFL
jgi:hypothetical protein